MRRLAFAAIAALMLAGCNPSSMQNWQKLSLGMTKAQVIDTLGSPKNTAAQGNVEYLSYTVVDNVGFSVPERRYVRIVNGKVDAFGAHGDFGTTQYPEQPVRIRTE